MHRRGFSAMLMALVGLAGLASTGCITDYGPNIGPWNSAISIPVPVSPYFQKIHEDKHRWHERYARVPILGPITEGGPAVALDPPSDEEIMMAFEQARPLQGGLPLLYEVQRNNVRILVEPVADYVDPPRFYPLVGPAQLHHAHYKCTIFFDEIVRVGWPLPHTLREEESQEVIYIDHCHLHILEEADTGMFSDY